MTCCWSCLLLCLILFSVVAFFLFVYVVAFFLLVYACVFDIFITFLHIFSCIFEFSLVLTHFNSFFVEQCAFWMFVVICFLYCEDFDISLSLQYAWIWFLLCMFIKSTISTCYPYASTFSSLFTSCCPSIGWLTSRITSMLSISCCWSLSSNSWSSS